ncbi:hypothetical protein BSR05_15520, partial [Escherichia coli]
GEEKVQKIAAGEEGNYRMERVPLKQTDRHHKSPGGDLCIRDSLSWGKCHFHLEGVQHHQFVNEGERYSNYASHGQ